MCDANASGIQPKLEPWQKARQEERCNNFLYLPPPLILSPHPLPSLVCPFCLRWIPIRRASEVWDALPSLGYTFHWACSSVSSPCHMLVSKTNEHVYPNTVGIFFSFSSLAVAHRSLSPVCFPSISHKSDLSKTLNTELPMFHPEWFRRLLKLVVFMAGAEKGTSRGHVALASCKVVRHTRIHSAPIGVDWGWAVGKCQEG